MPKRPCGATCTERAVMTPSAALLPETISVSPCVKSESLTAVFFSMSVVSVTFT